MFPAPQRFVRRTCLSYLLFLTIFPFTAAARAQSGQADILAQLKGKPLFLRGLWRRDALQFTHEGKPVQGYAAGPFTLAGIDVDKVGFSKDGLEIRGRRVGLEFGPRDGPRRVRLEWKNYNGKITIIIAGHQGEDFGPALTAIFARDLQTLISSPEQYWARVGDAYLGDANLDQAVDEAADEAVQAAVGEAPAASTPAPRSDVAAVPVTESAKPVHVGSAVRPPVLLSQVDPEFSEAARGLRYSGKVEVYLWLETSGVPSHLRVVRPAGLGLDEEAMAAVAAYRFKPATRNGEPVKVDLYVEVNFRIY